jgi:hypothetical protein
MPPIISSKMYASDDCKSSPSQGISEKEKVCPDSPISFSGGTDKDAFLSPESKD